MLRVDADSWTYDYSVRIHNDTPDTMRNHDMNFDSDGYIWLATANLSKHYAQGVEGMSKYDPKTGDVLEQVTLVPGSCDPHGLDFYKDATVACDAGRHPGRPDKDGPGAGWIFHNEPIETHPNRPFPSSTTCATLQARVGLYGMKIRMRGMES